MMSWSLAQTSRETENEPLAIFVSKVAARNYCLKTGLLILLKLILPFSYFIPQKRSKWTFYLYIRSQTVRLLTCAGFPDLLRQAASSAMLFAAPVSRFPNPHTSLKNVNELLYIHLIAISLSYKNEKRKKKPNRNKLGMLIKSRELLWRTERSFWWPIYLVTTQLTQNWTIILQCISALTIIKSDSVICMAIINSYLAFFFVLFSFLYDNVIAIRCTYILSCKQLSNARRKFRKNANCRSKCSLITHLETENNPKSQC